MIGVVLFVLSVVWTLCENHLNCIVLETSRVGEGWMKVEYWPTPFVVQPASISLHESGLPFIAKRFRRSQDWDIWDFYLVFPKAQGSGVLAEAFLYNVKKDRWNGGPVSILSGTDEGAIERCKAVSDDICAIWRAFNGQSVPEFLEIRL